MVSNGCFFTFTLYIKKNGAELRSGILMLMRGIESRNDIIVILVHFVNEKFAALVMLVVLMSSWLCTLEHWTKNGAGWQGGYNENQVRISDQVFVKAM